MSLTSGGLNIRREACGVISVSVQRALLPVATVMGMRVWQWLGGGEGFGAQLGTLLMLAVGAGLVGVSATDARELARGKPMELPCAEWSRAPLEKARWVSVTGCRLDIASAATRR